MGRNEVRLEQRNGNRAFVRCLWHFARILGMGVSHGERCHDTFLDHTKTSYMEHLHKLWLLHGMYVDINVLLAHLFSGCKGCQSNFERCESVAPNHQYHSLWDCWRDTW